jgi:hypothetical protein
MPDRLKGNKLFLYTAENTRLHSAARSRQRAECGAAERDVLLDQSFDAAVRP